MRNPNYFCVILAGGVGARLWPLSRQQKPKQFMDILGTGETLLQSTYQRFARFIEPRNILVMANQQHEDLVREQLPELPAENLKCEPMRRNTVPSVAWAAAVIQARNPKACMVVTPADQLITDEMSFERDILTGLRYATKHPRLLTLGVMPTHPDTTYGYIQMAEQMEPHIYRAKSFTEKPEQEFADLFFRNGEFLWNTGLYIWTVETFMQSLEENAGYFRHMLDQVHWQTDAEDDVVKMVERTFSMSPSISLELGLLEKVGNVDVLLCNFGWTDIGTWSAVYESLPKDEQNNVILARHALLNQCTDCIVKVPAERVIVMQGMRDYMVVEDGRVLVICKKDDQRTIRKFVNDVQMNWGDEFV